jgi:hypothetical protein
MSIKPPFKITCLFFLMFFVATPVCAGDKKDKEKLDRISAKIEEVKSGIIIRIWLTTPSIGSVRYYTRRRGTRMP